MRIVTRDIKDKRIELCGQAYVASILMMNGGVLNCGRHLSLKSAQKALAKYPPDVFEGNDNPAAQQDTAKYGRTPLRDEEEYANWETPRRKRSHDYTRLFDRRC